MDENNYRTFYIFVIKFYIFISQDLLANYTIKNTRRLFIPNSSEQTRAMFGLQNQKPNRPCAKNDLIKKKLNEMISKNNKCEVYTSCTLKTRKRQPIIDTKYQNWISHTRQYKSKRLQDKIGYAFSREIPPKQSTITVLLGPTLSLHLFFFFFFIQM